MDIRIPSFFINLKQIRVHHPRDVPLPARILWTQRDKIVAKSFDRVTHGSPATVVSLMVEEA